jgi:hypothetical protein
MTSVDVFQTLYTELEKHVEALKAQLIARFLPADFETHPRDWEIPSKAYCILAHAAFEEFVELVSLRVLSKAEELWKNHAILTRPIVTVISFHKIKIVTLNEANGDTQKIFDQIRHALKEAIRHHSKLIENNHGFNIEYLREILCPAAIDVEAEVRHTASIKGLCTARGTFAHKSAKDAGYKITESEEKKLTPDSASDLVGDCLDFCRLVAERAQKLFSDTALTNKKETPGSIVQHRK